jgi:Zn-dependent alcohol dehydrogenase
MKTRAAVLDGPGSGFRIEGLDLEPPRRGEVLVRVLAAGVCHSDWNLVTGATRHAFPVVAGHEGAGVVEAAGEGVSRLVAGDAVVLSWAPGCGSCFFCLEGRPALCSVYTGPLWAGHLLDGTTRLSRRGGPVHHFCGLACFAERTVVPEAACVKLGCDVPAPVAALIGCAVTTGVGAVLNTARLRPGSSVAVFGAGGVGLSIILGARLAGASPIIAVDRIEEKRAMARACGADGDCLSGPEALERIRAATGGRGADYVFEATGLPAVQEECLSAARAGGTVVLVGISPMGSATNLPGAIITREEKTVTGCYYGSSRPDRDFPLYARLYLEGKLALDRLVTKTYPLEEINQAYADMVAGRGARGVILLA